MFSISNAEFKNFLKIQDLGFWGLHRLSLALRPVLHKDLETLAQTPGPPKGPQNCNQRFAGDQRELSLACLGGDNGLESPQDWEICSPLRSALTLL